MDTGRRAAYEYPRVLEAWHKCVSIVYVRTQSTTSDHPTGTRIRGQMSNREGSTTGAYIFLSTNRPVGYVPDQSNFSAEFLVVQRERECGIHSHLKMSRVTLRTFIHGSWRFITHGRTLKWI